MGPNESKMALVSVVMASLSGLACGDNGGQTTTTYATTEEGSTTLVTSGPVTTGPTTGVSTTGETTGVTGPATTGSTGATAAESTSSTGTTAGESTGETTGGGGPALPAVYRFDCLDIVELGDSNGDMQPDGQAIQALLLENTWLADIQEHRLNILLTVRSNDAASGMAEMAIASGIGQSDDDLCSDAPSMSPALSGSYDPAMAAWQPLEAPGQCAEPANAGASYFGGTYSLELGSQDVIYVHAQEADGTVLNCVPGGDGVTTPNAVPLHAVQSVLTLSESGDVAAGELTGCLLASEAQDLCSCLSNCQGVGHPDCGGCPDGSVPLSALLGGVGPTTNCTNVMGATAYDMRVRFATQRISMEEPMACAG